MPDSAWADGNLVEVAGQLGKMVEHRNQRQPNQGLKLTWDTLYLLNIFTFCLPIWGIS